MEDNTTHGGVFSDLLDVIDFPTPGQSEDPESESSQTETHGRPLAVEEWAHVLCSLE